jgi:hypothetical protein
LELRFHVVASRPEYLLFCHQIRDFWAGAQASDECRWSAPVLSVLANFRFGKNHTARGRLLVSLHEVLDGRASPMHCVRCDSNTSKTATTTTTTTNFIAPTHSERWNRETLPFPFCPPPFAPRGTLCLVCSPFAIIYWVCFFFLQEGIMSTVLRLTADRFVHESKRRATFNVRYIVTSFNK